MPMFLRNNNSIQFLYKCVCQQQQRAYGKQTLINMYIKQKQNEHHQSEDTRIEKVFSKRHCFC